MHTKVIVRAKTTGSAFFALILATALMSGCATVPAPLAGDRFSAITPKEAVAEKGNGREVRWGGEIFAVEPGADRTCFAVLSRALLNDARPDRRGSANGTFVACRPGFLDPALYPEGSDITVVGTLDGNEEYQSGYSNLELPKVDATEIYLWPEYRWDNYAAFDGYSIVDSCAYAWDYSCLGSGYYANLARYCPYGPRHRHHHSISTAGYGRIAAAINRAVQAAHDRERFAFRNAAVRAGYIAAGPRFASRGYGGHTASYGGRSQSFGGARASSGGNPGGRSSGSGSAGGSTGSGNAVAVSSASAGGNSGGGRSVH